MKVARFILGVTGVACQSGVRRGVFWHGERARRVAYQPVFLAAERKDNGHPLVDVADGFVRLGREDREIHQISKVAPFKNGFRNADLGVCSVEPVRD